MKKLILLMLFFSIASVATGEVSTRVSLADGNTPLELADANNYIYRDVMVGTKLTILVDSNVGEYWLGDLTIEGSDQSYGQLFARDYNDATEDYDGSHFEAAGPEADVFRWEEPDINGFSFNTDFDDEDIDPGEWFILDYNAIDIGDCNVVFYQDFVEDYQLSFTHVATRDFNSDTIVNFVDFAVLASYWRGTSCSGPSWCEGTDLNTDGYIDPNDLMLFVDYWLETTE